MPDADSRFAPVGVQPRYEAPRAAIGPATEQSWLKRALPVVLAHRWVFGLSLVLSFVGLLVQVQIPVLMGRAINLVADGGHGRISGYITWIVALALVRGLLTYGARLSLLRTAYDMEYDFRTIIYEHLTRMSFSFYDRVQSGQLISRANSDIRSVQLYLTFGPNIVVQCCIALVALDRKSVV